MAKTDWDYSDSKHNKWRHAQSTITFDGGTVNAIGDHDGTGDPFTIFTVTGDVIVKVVGVCTTLLDGASGTVEVGTSLDTDAILPTTTATDIDAMEIWHDASPDNSVELSSVLVEEIVAGGDDIIGTVATANITAGVIRFICLWKPLSRDGNVAGV